MTRKPSGFEHARAGDEVVITHHGRVATTLRGAAADRFLAHVDEDPQQLMARVTGNYRHGNERAAKDHPRNRGG